MEEGIKSYHFEKEVPGTSPRSSQTPQDCSPFPQPPLALPSVQAPPRRALALPGALPVGCQPRRDVAARNLRDDVAPKERTVDHPYGFWVPVEFGFLWE